MRLSVEAVGEPRATFSAYIHTRFERSIVEGPWPIQAIDDDERFDAMSLALYAFDERQREAPTPSLEAWFDDRLRRDFSLLGHLVRYWSCLQQPKLEPSDPQYSFAISVQMRRIYWDCLRPFDLKRG